MKFVSLDYILKIFPDGSFLKRIIEEKLKDAPVIQFGSDVCGHEFKEDLKNGQEVHN